MRILDLVPDERPREKMRLRGAKSLSNAELLAILLGSGTGGKNVMEVAQELMVCAGGRLTLLGAMPLEKLMEQKGVGEVRAIAIAAALELGRRCFELPPGGGLLPALPAAGSRRCLKRRRTAACFPCSKTWTMKSPGSCT